MSHIFIGTMGLDSDFDLMSEMIPTGQNACGIVHITGVAFSYLECFQIAQTYVSEYLNGAPVTLEILSLPLEDMQLFRIVVGSKNVGAVKITRLG